MESKPNQDEERHNMPTLFEKIRAAQKGCVYVRADSEIKGGGASGHKYASKQAIYSGVRRHIHDAGLSVVMSVKELRQEFRDVPDKDATLKQYMFVTVILEWTIGDAETGENIKVESVGTASEKAYNADSLPQQAQTTAIRTFYSDFFQIPIVENQNQVAPPASDEQYNRIKTLMGQLKEAGSAPSAEEYGKMIGMSPGESKMGGDTYKKSWREYWGSMMADRAEAIIQELQIRLRAPKAGDIPEDFFGKKDQ